MSCARWARSRTAPRRDSAAIAASRLRVGMRSSNVPPPPSRRRADRRGDDEPALLARDVLDPRAHRVDVARARGERERGRALDLAAVRDRRCRASPATGRAATLLGAAQLAAPRCPRRRSRAAAARAVLGRRGAPAPPDACSALPIAGVSARRRSRNRRCPPSGAAIAMTATSSTVGGDAERGRHPALPGEPAAAGRARARVPSGEPALHARIEVAAEAVGRAAGAPRAAAARARPARSGRARRGARRARRRAPRARARRRG